MDFRTLGGSGLKVPVLGLGTGTFGGGGEFFKGFGASDVAEATRLVDVCLEAGLNLFDSADIYSGGLAEEILGKAHRRPARPGPDLDEGHLPLGDGPERRGLVAPPPVPGRRGEPAAPAAPTTSTSTSSTASTP